MSVVDVDVAAIFALSRAKIQIPCVRIGEHAMALPRYATRGDSGLDLRADLTYFARSTTERDANGRPVLSRGARWIYDDADVIHLDHGARLTVGCGFAFGTSIGLEWQVRPRSGGSVKGIDVAFGTVDRNYIGEVTFTISNWTGWPFAIKHADRLAQIVLVPVFEAEPYEVTELAPTARGANGRGSTGVA